jgi:hypothetical protein
MEAPWLAPFQEIQVMTARIASIVFCLFTVLLPAVEKVPDFEHGQRPPDAVFDPNGLLEPNVLKEISAPLAKIFKDEQIDIIVVILADIAGAPPERVAGQFAAAWCDSPMHAVVLHVQGRQDGPWIVPGGRLIDCIKPEKLAQSVADAQRDASREPNEQAMVRTAASEAADMLRYWRHNAINRVEFIRNARAEIQMEQQAKAIQWRIAKLTGAACVIPVMIGVSMLILKFRKRGPRRFPETNPPRRLGAPHAGGNFAVADLGPTPP